jgi:hypothetical protein
MERDNQNNNTGKAENAGPEDVTAAAHIQVQDFSRVEQEGVAKPHEENERKLREALGQEPGAVTALSDSGPGFVDISGDVGGPGHNETSVDIIAVPCPGADPLQTWTYDHGFDSDCSIPSDIGSRSSLRRPSPWVTKDLRGKVHIGRVFLYRHRALEDGMTLKSLSKDLLDQVEQMRRGAVGVIARSYAPTHADYYSHSHRDPYSFSPIASAVW